MPHTDAAAVARQLIDDTPDTAAMEPEERERLHQTIEGIIIRARRYQHCRPEDRPWARNFHTRTGRDARRGDGENAS
jgi:hypothetical protein